MGLKNRPQVKMLPSAPWGVIGMAKFSMSGGVVSLLQVAGCIKNVTLPSSSQCLITLWPQQKVYTVAAACSYTTNASYMSFDVTTTTFSPSSFQLQGVGINPDTGIGPPIVLVTVFGPVTTPGKNSQGQLWGGSNRGLAVIGMASFGTDAGIITGLRKWGVVSGVNYTGTSTVDILLNGAPSFYTACGSCASDGVNASVMGITSNGVQPNKLSLQSLGTNPVTGRNCQVFTVTIFGQRPAGMWQRRQWPIGVIGAAIFRMPSSTTIGNLQTFGCVERVVSGGTNLPSVYFLPQQQQFTFMSHSSADAVVPTYTAWNANAISGNGPTYISLQPTGTIPDGARTAGLNVVTIFGPLNQSST